MALRNQKAIPFLKCKILRVIVYLDIETDKTNMLHPFVLGFLFSIF